MKRLISIFAALAFMTGQLVADVPTNRDEKYNERADRTGEGAIRSANSGTALSMFGWGLGLAGGIALISSVIGQSKEDNGGNNQHAHCF